MVPSPSHTCLNNAFSISAHIFSVAILRIKGGLLYLKQGTPCVLPEILDRWQQAAGNKSPVDALVYCVLSSFGEYFCALVVAW